MFICDRLSAAFVHIPKTGGTAIKTHLFGPLGYRRVGDKHGPSCQLPASHRAFFIFAFVRNPYRRMASQYRFRALTDTKNGLFKRVFPRMSDFLIRKIGDYRGPVGNLPVRQCEWIDDCVRVYRYERFDEGVADICDRLGVPKIRIERSRSVNHLGSYDWRDEFRDDPMAVDLINQHCAPDFEVFGYSARSYDQLMSDPASA